MSAKGKFDDNCNRSACQEPIKGANWWNSSTRAYYCEPCARSINEAALQFDGVVICTAVTDPADQPPFPWQEINRRQAVSST
jgi:hypothetical protein